MQHFHGKLSCQKSMFKQIEWEVQNGPMTKNIVFSKLYFSLGTSHKELIRCTNYPNFHIHTFWKGWGFI